MIVELKPCPFCGGELNVCEGTIWMRCERCDFEESIFEIVVEEIEALEQKDR